MLAISAPLRKLLALFAHFGVSEIHVFTFAAECGQNGAIGAKN
jgi:hypothetical protein